MDLSKCLALSMCVSLIINEASIHLVIRFEDSVFILNDILISIPHGEVTRRSLHLIENFMLLNEYLDVAYFHPSRVLMPFGEYLE